ncbi:hypothetical protein [Butyribacter intestini]|uniref:hypothetical protein n=1 Tax=Butyribacter intestini TaxID=1703332 RepID=UPI0022DFB53D|nr:hypothetical protein [Butyribacter intestini]
MNITKIVSNGYIFSIVKHDYINDPTEVVLVQRKSTDCGIKFDFSEKMGVKEALKILSSISPSVFDELYKRNPSVSAKPGDEIKISWSYPGQTIGASAPIFNTNWLEKQI